nr:unnamed protein product [Digitaria exilis]
MPGWLLPCRYRHRAAVVATVPAAAARAAAPWALLLAADRARPPASRPGVWAGRTRPASWYGLVTALRLLSSSQTVTMGGFPVSVSSITTPRPYTSRAVGHELGDDDALAVGAAPADEADDVAVGERPEAGELRPEGAAPHGPVDERDARFTATSRPSWSLHRPGVAGAEHDGEVVRRNRDLRQRELLRP